MATSLGLDIGTNSIGWCLMEDKRNILGMGVRIFPVGVNEESYSKSYKEESKNAVRRSARGIRRLNQRYKLRRKALKKILAELNMYSDDFINIPSKELFGLRSKALCAKVSLEELGRIFLHLNQRRGFKSNKKSDAGTSETAKERSDMKLKMNELAQKVTDGGFKTIGEYYYSLFNQPTDWRNPDEPVERIKGRFVWRKLYEEEFDFIWNVQKKFYPDLLNDINYKRIKDDTIYYQRKLKSQKHLVSKCRFEPNKRCAPKSHPLFQEFRMLSVINNLRVTDKERFREELSTEDKKLLASKLTYEDSLSLKKIKDLLGISTRGKFNDLGEKIRGNETYTKLTKALGKDYFDKLNEEKRIVLWNTLFFADDEEWLYNYAKDKLMFSEKQSKDFSELNVHETSANSSDYSNISVKAMRNLLPIMRGGVSYDNACMVYAKQTGNKRYLHYLENPDKEEVEVGDKVLRTKNDDLRNPLVQMAVSETIRLVNAVICEYGKPDRIKVEFAREMKKPRDVREKIHRKNRDKELLRESYRTFLKNRFNKEPYKNDILKFELWLEMEFSEKDLTKINHEIDVEEFRKFSKNIKAEDTKKYSLWLECGRISPYTGKVINLSNLFSPDIEIEHIIPYSLSMDDSFLNKTLCERDFNQEKGNRTAYQYFKDKPELLHDFKQRIMHFSDEKQERFMRESFEEGFLNSQLSNTAYIARQTKKKLKMVCKDVRITNGQATSILRRFWGLNRILNTEDENLKTRDDHRHHAIDAFVIANTEQSNIQQLSTESKFRYDGRFELKEHNSIKTPYDGFLDEVKDNVERIFISYRNKKRLISRKKNRIKTKTGEKVQMTYSLRGGLHEESLFGRVFSNEFKESYFVIKKPLKDFTSLKQIYEINKKGELKSGIVDKGVREIILKHIESNGGEKKIKEALLMPIYITSRDGSKKIPIKTVRVFDNAKAMIPIRTYENGRNVFVNSGNNYLIAIYENPENRKRKFETITFFDAVQKAIAKEPIVKKNIDDYNLFLELKQKDLVVFYKEHRDEIDWNDEYKLFVNLYRVLQIDINGKLTLGKHNLSKIDARKDTFPIVIRNNHNTIKAIKVEIDILGKIKKIV